MNKKNFNSLFQDFVDKDKIRSDDLVDEFEDES